MKLVTELEVYPTNAPNLMTLKDAFEWCAALGDGWRLPTKDELNLMYKNKDAIGGFGGGWFWSSSQNSYYYAWTQDFSRGVQGSYSTYNTISVRACRAFNYLSIKPLSKGGES